MRAIRKTLYFVAFACVSIISGSALAEENEVLLFADSVNQFINKEGYKVIYLDEVQRIEDQLTQSLSGFELTEDMTSEQLEAVQQRLSSSLDEQALLDAYAGLALAWSMNITHIPAVVFNGYVVYGEKNVSQALERIRQ